MTSDEDSFALIPSQPGTYVLVMHLCAPIELEVGRLGTSQFPSGWYLYVGSARGSGGLAARLARHRRQNKRLHWHIDYLLDAADLIEGWWSVSPHPQECRWAQTLAHWTGTCIPLAHFGASDCSCVAHLFHTPVRPSFALAHRLSGEGPVHRSTLSCPASSSI